MALLEDARLLDLRVFAIRWEGGESGDEWSFTVDQRSPGVDWSGQCPSPSPYAPNMRNPMYLHTNGCGDFTMLSRRAWFAMRAYPEMPIWPMHVDSLICYAAHHAGLREVVLEDPMRIFHIQHLAGAGTTPEGEQELYARVARKGRAHHRVP